MLKASSVTTLNCGKFCPVDGFNTNGTSLLYFGLNPTNMPFLNRGYQLGSFPPTVEYDPRHIMDNPMCEHTLTCDEKTEY